MFKSRKDSQSRIDLASKPYLQDLPTTIVGFGVKSVVADERENCFVFVRDAESGAVYLNDTACDAQRAVVCELEIARDGY